MLTNNTRFLPCLHLFYPFPCSAVLHSILLLSLSKLFHTVAVHYRNTSHVSYSGRIGNVAFQKISSEPRDVLFSPLMFRSLSRVEKVGHLGTHILKSFSKHINAAGGKEIKTKTG